MRARSRARLFVALASVTTLVAACSWDPHHPFDREAPEVKQALSAFDAGDGAAAASVLQDYLGTGGCTEGKIGAPPLLKKRPDGTFDLGLSLFSVGESYGHRFGDEEVDSGLPNPNERDRKDEIECALTIVRAIAADEDQPIELRARARYLEGNLLFMQREYEAAVHAYDQALVLAPGMLDGGDPVGRDAAWNRAIALRRIEDKKDAGDQGDAASDASKDASQDAKSDAPNDGGNDGGGDSGGDSGNDSGHDGGGNDGGSDASQPPPPPQDEPDASPPPPSSENQDDRILDQLERAPTVQQEAAKKAASQHRVRGMADK